MRRRWSIQVVREDYVFRASAVAIPLREKRLCFWERAGWLEEPGSTLGDVVPDKPKWVLGKLSVVMNFFELRLKFQLLEPDLIVVSGESTPLLVLLTQY